MRRCRLSPMTKYVGFALAQYANTDGTNAFPSVAKLALVTGLAERTIRKGLTDLRGLGLIVRDRKGGMRGTQSYSDLHHLAIPADLLERVELLTPGEEIDPANRQEVPPGDDPNRHVSAPQPAPGAAQPASDGIPTGTTCLLPISTYLARDTTQDQPSGSFGTQPTTGGGARNDDGLLAQLVAIDELAARRRGA